MTKGEVQRCLDLLPNDPWITADRAYLAGAIHVFGDLPDDHDGGWRGSDFEKFYLMGREDAKNYK